MPPEYGAHTHAHVLDRHGADAAAAAGLDSGDRHLSQYAGLDDVGRGFLLRALSLAGALEAPGRGWRRICAKLAGVWMLGMVPGALYIAFNPDGIRASRPLELGPLAAGAQIHAAAAPGQLCLRRDAGRAGRDHCRAGPSAPVARPGRLCRHLRF